MGTRQDHENQAIEDLRSYGRSLVSTVSSGQTEAFVGRVLSARHQRHRPRRLVLALSTLGLLAISNVALAAVSNPAAPGDLLYAVDRGYERAGDLFGGWLFGVGDRTQERLAESEALNLRGETDEAIALLRSELTVESSDASQLSDAIDKLESQGNQGQGNPNEQGPATPAETAPGQVDGDGNGQSQPNPSDTAPGNSGDSPSDDAPGQNKDQDSKDNPSDDAPGQNQDTTTTSVAPGNGNGNGGNSNGGNGNGNGNGGNGNNGQGNNGP